MTPKESLIADLLVLLDDDARYEFEERAGIMEYEGGAERDDAEAYALIDLLRRHPGALLRLYLVQVDLPSGTRYFLVDSMRDLDERLPQGIRRFLEASDAAEVLADARLGLQDIEVSTWSEQPFGLHTSTTTKESE